MADPDAWDAEDFEPELPSRQQTDDKWEGEDEDDGVKVNWEDSDDQDTATKKEEELPTYQRPKKKPIADRLAEKEAQSKKEEEQKVKQKEEKKATTVEEKLAERERQKKLKEQESLSLARGLFAAGDANTSVDQMTPLSESEFEQFGEALKNKIQFFEESQHYNAFVLQLINDLSLTLCAEEVKKLGVTINSMYHEKERQRKEAEKKKKKKSKVSIKMGREDDLDIIGDAATGSYYDDEDFL